MTEEANNYDGDACTIEKAIADQPRGKGFRPEFPALWHLWELGVLEGSIFAPESKAWDKAKDAASVRVVVVDTPIARNHPRFEGVIDMGASRDFTVSVEGRALGDLCGPPDPMHANAGAHGTAVAGLIGARPNRIRLRIPSFVYDGNPICSHDAEDLLALPYAGVNPFVGLISIALPAATRPETLLAAIAYIAEEADPDVVVVADTWLPVLTPPEEGECDYDRKKEEYESWQEVEAVFLRLCERCIVLCAAGNEPLDHPVYPASLSDRQVGPWAVGACDTEGRDLT